MGTRTDSERTMVRMTQQRTDRRTSKCRTFAGTESRKGGSGGRGAWGAIRDDVLDAMREHTVAPNPPRDFSLSNQALTTLSHFSDAGCSWTPGSRRPTDRSRIARRLAFEEFVLVDSAGEDDYELGRSDGEIANGFVSLISVDDWYDAELLPQGGSRPELSAV